MPPKLQKNPVEIIGTAFKKGEKKTTVGVTRVLFVHAKVHALKC